jgi:hypothetical protein
VLHRVGEGEDIVAQLAVGEAAFWVASASLAMKRFSPRSIDGATSRMLLIVDDPRAAVAQAASAGHPSSPAWQTNMGGVSAGSAIHSATNGRSECPSATGRHADPETVATVAPECYFPHEAAMQAA